ncbi:MAG: GAF domain-containing sensor histidine kinase [Chloroflexota bacterium]
MPHNQQLLFGEALLEAVQQTFETETNDPLTLFFLERSSSLKTHPSNPELELACLEATLMPILPDLQTSKYLSDVLTKVRFTLLEADTRRPLTDKTIPSTDPSDNTIRSALATYYRQLQNDSLFGLLFTTTILAVYIIAMLAITATTTFDYITRGLYLVVALVVGRVCWILAKQERQVLSARLFIWSYLILITVIISLTDNQFTFLPFLYSYFIIISSTLIKPEESFNIWFYSTLLILVSIGLVQGAGLSGILVYGVAIGVNLFFALAGYFTTLDWHQAVQSTSILHLRAQHRRDQLFAVQKELEQANRQQKSLYTQLITSVEIGQRLTAVLELDTLLKQVVDLIRQKLEFTYVGIFLLEKGRFLALRAQAGDSSSSSQPQPLISIEENNILGVTARNRRLTAIPNVRDTDLIPHPYLAKNALSEISLPLIVGDQLQGVLTIQSYGVNAFTEEKLPILRLLRNQIVIALHNAQLFDATIIARQEAEQANEIKSQFLANMSHELRTPLNAIINFTGFVADGIFGDVNAGQADALEKSLDSSSHLLSLINDILDLAKVEAGAMEMFLQEIDIVGILKGTAATAKGLLKNKNIELIVDIDETIPAITGDKRRLRQVMLNLVSNAIKFTKEGSITLKADVRDDLVQIMVKDTGIGIAPTDQQLIFESFHQAQNGISSSLGTGLGLPIAKHFIELHQGQIWVESSPGSGTTFFINLPRNIKEADLQPV